MNRSLAKLRWLSTLLCLVLALALLAPPGRAAVPVSSAAQNQPTPEPTSSPEPEVVYYIVQSGDTLFGIAQRFGVPLELLAAANNITDPSVLQAGQQLIIPPPPPPPEPRLEHVVEPGETLHSLSLRYGWPPAQLGRPNYLIRPDLLTIGATLTITGLTEPPPPLRGQTHPAEPGETLAGLALQYGVSAWELALANQLPSPWAPLAVERLWIPGTDGAFWDWPAPFAGVALHPLPAMQGLAFAAQITLTHPVSLTGNLLGEPLTFHQHATGAVALAGISALAPAGTPMLVMTATLKDGDQVYYAQQMPVVAGDYGSEDIVVADEIAAGMTAEVIQAEFDLLNDLFALQTPVRQWDGLFALPAEGEVTSLFGTRRSYNIPNGSAYHTGTDLGRAAGTPVYAPAAGTVIFTGTLAIRGNVVIIDHGWGVMTGYWHLSASHVSPGQMVETGQHIGDIGNTGLSTGPHLHWELRIGGVPVDGLQWVRELFP